jgi:hypothetical protein
VKPAKQLVSPLASSAVTVTPPPIPAASTAAPVPPQPSEQSDIDADTFAKQASGFFLSFLKNQYKYLTFSIYIILYYIILLIK